MEKNKLINSKKINLISEDMRVFMHMHCNDSCIYGNNICKFEKRCDLLCLYNNKFKKFGF